MKGRLGVPVARVYTATFAFGVALAGLAGALLAPIYSVFPTMERDFARSGWRWRWPFWPARSRV